MEEILKCDISTRPALLANLQKGFDDHGLFAIRRPAFSVGNAQSSF
jgi:hypothetical protein